MLGMSSPSMAISSTWTRPGRVVSRNSCATAEICRASSTSRVVTQVSAAVCSEKITRSARTSIRR
jgi:hypothetical protein